MKKYTRSKLSPARAQKLIAKERAKWAYLGSDGKYFQIQAPGGTKSGFKTQEGALQNLEMTIAARVLESVGIDDWNQYDHSYDYETGISAKSLVLHVVAAEKEYREANEAPDRMRSLVAAMIDQVRS